MNCLKIKELLCIFILFSISSTVFTEELPDYDDYNEEYYDIGGYGAISIIGERPPEYEPESIEAIVLSSLNGSLPERKNFIENNLLENAGFRRTGNVRYRKTDGGEKTLSVLHGVANLLSFGVVPMKSFSEVDYGRLPDGEYYTFQSVIGSSGLKDILPEVLVVLELEYMLQIEFCYGILIENNKRYYTKENMEKFEILILKLSDYPESIKQLKERYLDIELPKIKNALERYNNPSENYLQALENLKDIRGKN